VQDTELYRHLLGIEKPWTVARVALAVSEQRVHVFVEHKAGEEFACPECGKKLGVYDHAEERTCRHLDSCQFATMLRRIGVDEKAVAKRHKCLTIVSNLEKGTVEFLAEGRTKASFFSYLAPYTLAEADESEAIAMDMWSPFFETATASIPFGADKIVFDRYHVVQHMNHAVDQVRGRH
jgi:transposase